MDGTIDLSHIDGVVLLLSVFFVERRGHTAGGCEGGPVEHYQEPKFYQGRVCTLEGRER